MKKLLDIFRRKTNKDSKSFSLEYYPITNRYYPKYKQFYLLTDPNTGIINTKESCLFTFVDFATTREKAESIIDLFKEQQLKHNVKTIYLNK